MCVSNKTYFYEREVYKLRCLHHKNLQRGIFSSYNYMPSYKGEAGNAPKFKILQQIFSNELTAYHSTLLRRCTSKKGSLFWRWNLDSKLRGNLPSALRAVLKTEVIVLRRENISPHERIGGGTLGAQYFTIYKWLWVYIWALTQKLGVFLRTNIHRN